MEVTGAEALSAIGALQQIGRMKINVKGAVAVAKAIQELNLISEQIEPRRMDLLKKHAETDENGELVVEDNQVQFGKDKKVAEERMAEFNREWVELLGEKVTIERRVKISDLGDIEVEPTLLLSLGEILEE